MIHEIASAFHRRYHEDMLNVLINTVLACIGRENPHHIDEAAFELLTQTECESETTLQKSRSIDIH